MDTTLVNIRTVCVRYGYANLQDWMSDPDNIYIGRAGVTSISKQKFPAENSEWHNPFGALDKSSALSRYQKYLCEKLKDDECLERFKQLSGKNLGCWCKPKKCHGDVIVKILRSIEQNI